MEARTDLSLFNERISQIRKRISSVIVGQQEAVDMLITCILANGHVLIEGMPGVAKTLMARLTAKLIDAKFSRIQFTLFLQQFFIHSFSFLTKFLCF